MLSDSVDYEAGFYAWTIEQARLLRSGEPSTIHAANIALRGSAPRSVQSNRVDTTFPAASPFSVEEVLPREFRPER